MEKFALKDFNLVGFFAVESFSCSGKKPQLKPKQQVLNILGDPGADKGGEGKSKRAEKYIWNEEK